MPPRLAQHIAAFVAEGHSGQRSSSRRVFSGGGGGGVADAASVAGHGRRFHRFPHRAPKHGWGDEVCLRRHGMYGATCQVQCDESDADVATGRPQADILTLPPFTPTLRNDTFVNDVFWVAKRTVAPALFDHLKALSSWGWHEQERASRRRRRPPAAAGSSRAVSEPVTVDALCGSAPRLRASPSCTDEHRLSSEGALTCATGGHECMVTQAVAALSSKRSGNAAESSDAADATAPISLLRVRYLPEARASPQVLRLADTDERFCSGMQLAYLCSEKRKVRRAPAAGALSGDKAAQEALATAFAERQKRCKQADRSRVQVKTRTDALSSKNRTSTWRRTKKNVKGSSTAG